MSIQLTVRNLAIDSFVFWLVPLTSARARFFIAGGPTGIIIMTHQSMGSSVRRFVRDARTQMSGMLILFLFCFR